MEKENMIAFCGLDCSKCDAYIATRNDNQALREKTAKLWSEMNNVTILPEQIMEERLCTAQPYARFASVHAEKAWPHAATAQRWTDAPLSIQSWETAPKQWTT